MICLDEFGPLNLQPHRGQGGYPVKEPVRLPATYTRPHGVRHLLCAYDLKTDKLYARRSPSKKHGDILSFIQMLRRRFHRSERIYLVLDNFSPHKHRKVRQWVEENNMELVFTPTYSSWLNRIECHLGPLRRFVLNGSYYTSHDELFNQIRAYIRWRNKNKRHEAILREQKKIKVA